MILDLLGCAIAVEAKQMNAIVRTESSVNPFAVGVVGHYISRQPTNKNEAEKLVKELKEKGVNYSVGLAQVNQINFKTYGLNYKNMFNKCENLAAGSKILKSCYDKYDNWDKAYSCYYSGNDVTGFQHGYVKKVKFNLKSELVTKVLTATSSKEKIKLFERGRESIEVKTKRTLLMRRLSVFSKVSGANDNFTNKKYRRLKSKISNEEL